MITFIHDLKCPNDPQGRTYKEINQAKTHSYPIGTLVELKDGVRVWIVAHTRDCDETPLYQLSPKKDDTIVEKQGYKNRSWIGGFPEYNLKVIKKKK